MSEKNFLTEMENLFLALSDKTRLRLLNLMRAGEVCVNHLTEILNESQPKISRHLAFLRGANLVSVRRDGKWMHYKITFPPNPFAANLLQDTLEWLEAQDAMRRDYEKLTKFDRSDVSAETGVRATPNIYVEKDMKTSAREELPAFLL